DRGVAARPFAKSRDHGFVGVETIFGTPHILGWFHPSILPSGPQVWELPKVNLQNLSNGKPPPRLLPDRLLAR
ncbi:MAG: hypothetical protein M3131_03115, partial [Actinomycetota bacterium]|nr:hypothetical protein [Actinomycetota bacterium]